MCTRCGVWCATQCGSIVPTPDSQAAYVIYSAVHNCLNHIHPVVNVDPFHLHCFSSQYVETLLPFPHQPMSVCRLELHALLATKMVRVVHVIIFYIYSRKMSDLILDLNEGHSICSFSVDLLEHLCAQVYSAPS